MLHRVGFPFIARATELQRMPKIGGRSFEFFEFFRENGTLASSYAVAQWQP
jgi:hypothetical protein